MERKFNNSPGMCFSLVFRLILAGAAVVLLHDPAKGQAKKASVFFISLDASAQPQVIRKAKAIVAGHESPAWENQAAEVIITVDVSSRGQVMDGVGGAFNELGWKALEALPAGQRRKIMRNIFDVKRGAALRFNRIPIGASDFARTAYSLDDSVNDWSLKYFSIERDRQCLIPYIKSAQAVNPGMKFHASPWSPPGWMKTNGKQTGGGQLLDDDRTLRALADYLVRFLQSYREQDIFVNRLCPQNEPLVSGSYPGCKISPELYGRALKEFIIPAIRNAHLLTEVWAGTFNYWRADTRWHFDGILADSGLVQAVGGISFQYSNMDWVREYRKRYPRLPVQFSESECYNGTNSYEEVCRDFQDFVAYTREGSKLFTFWNMVLPEPHKSTWGWKQNSLVVIDTATKRITYEPSYALGKMIGHFVHAGDSYVHAVIDKGAEKIKPLLFEPKDCVKFMDTRQTGGTQVVAFRRKNGMVNLLLLNQGEEIKATIDVGKRQYDAILPANSLVAISLR